MKVRRIAIVAGVIVPAVCMSLAAAGAQDKPAPPADIPADRAGTCLVVGDGGGLAEAIARGSALTVYCLDADLKRAAGLRGELDAAGLYGTRVTVDVGGLEALPYADFCADVLVAAAGCRTAPAELWRVAKPGGVVYLPAAAGGAGEAEKALRAGGVSEFEVLGAEGAWVRLRRLRPAGMDEWSHVNHGPDNDARSRDTVLTWPFRTQWINSGPLAPCMVGSKIERMTLTVGGRLFHKRETAVGNCVAALDAYDGRVLWTHHQHPAKPLSLAEWKRLGPDRLAGVMRHMGIEKDKYYEVKRDKKPETAGQGERWSAMLGHGEMISPFVADEKRVYVSNVLEKGCVVLDAATGQEVAKVLLPGEPEAKAMPGPWQYMALEGGRLYGSRGGVLGAVEAATGKPLWKYEGLPAPHTAAIGEANIMFFDWRAGAIALDKVSGQRAWARPEEAANIPLGHFAKPPKKGNIRHFACVFARKGVWVVSGAAGVTGYDEKSGATLWTFKLPGAGEEGGKFFNYGRYWYGRQICSLGDGGEVYVDGVGVMDPAAGKVVKTMFGGATACARPTVANGMIFRNTHPFSVIDMKTGRYFPGPRLPLRNACGANPGGLAANGMAYLAENGCNCSGYVMNGNVAFASAGQFKPGKPLDDLEHRFVKGEEAVSSGNRPFDKAQGRQSEDWPCYRHDTARTGATTAELPDKPVPAWTLDCPGEPTSPAVAGGTVFVGTTASRVVAIDAASGKGRWTFLTGGPVVATPTWWEGKVYVGAQDGWVHCLAAETGRAIWSFRAAPQARKVMQNGVLRSVWSPSGGVMVHGGKAYFHAGFLAADGTYLYRADARTGKIEWSSGEPDLNPQGTMAVARDLLIVSQGASRPAFYPLAGGKAVTVPNRYNFGGPDPVVFGDMLLCGGRRMDGNEHSFRDGLPRGQRLYIIQYLPGASEWLVENTSHWPETGNQLGGLTNSDDAPLLLATPAVCEDVIYQAGHTGARAVAKAPVIANRQRASLNKQARWVVKFDPPAALTLGDAVSLIKAGGQVVTARPAGKGGVLAAYDAATGAALWQQPLPAQAVTNGLAAAGGRLYVSLAGGKVICLGGEK